MSTKDNLTRREFIIAGAAIAGIATGGKIAFSGEDEEFLLGKVGDFPAGTVKLIDKYAVISEADGLYCLSRKCTHKGQIINYDKETSDFVCPAHGAMFKKDGTVIKKPAKRDLDRIMLKIKNNELYAMPGHIVPKGTLIKRN